MTDNTSARKKAMKLLEYRDRTEKELHDRLIREGFDEEQTADALSYVRSFGYLSDRRFAENYIFFSLRKKSRQRILEELRRKGVSRETAEEAFLEAAGEEEHDERELILREIRKKYPDGEVPDEKKQRSLYASLARRGFRHDDILSALREIARGDFSE